MATKPFHDWGYLTEDDHENSPPSKMVSRGSETEKARVPARTPTKINVLKSGRNKESPKYQSLLAELNTREMTIEEVAEFLGGIERESAMKVMDVLRGEIHTFQRGKGKTTYTLKSKYEVITPLSMGE